MQQEQHSACYKHGTGDHWPLLGCDQGPISPGSEKSKLRYLRRCCDHQLCLQTAEVMHLSVLHAISGCKGTACAVIVECWGKPCIVIRVTGLNADLQEGWVTLMKLL